MADTLAERINRPLTIGGRRIAPRLVLAPMSKVGHPAFRRVLAGFGGFGLLFTEMCGARTVRHGVNPIPAGFWWHPDELPHLVCQLFGDDPQDMAEAARRIEAEGFFGVDLNFGCCVNAVCRQGSGAALLKKPLLAERIVRAVRRAVTIPVFVKFRTGWRDDGAAAVALGRRFEQAGADALTFHPRVAPDRRSRPPRWEYIGALKRSVGIPVLGNGNVFDASDCQRLLDETGCDGVSLGRLAVARPWVFAQWSRGYRPPPTIHRHCALEMAARCRQLFDPATALRRYRTFISYFAANFTYGHSLTKALHGAPDMAAAVARLKAFCDPAPQLNARLNLSLMR